MIGNNEQFLQLTVSLGLFFVCLFVSFSSCLLAIVVLGLVSSVGLLSQEIDWEERLRNDLFCVELDVKP